MLHCGGHDKRTKSLAYDDILQVYQLIQISPHVLNTSAICESGDPKIAVFLETWNIAL